MRRVTSILASAATVAAITASGIGAATPAQAATGCTPTTGGQTYLSAWNDYDTYVVAPGGSFSTSTSSWTGWGATINRYVNSPYNVTGSSTGGALSVNSGGGATSPQMCIKWSDDHIRLFFKAPYGSSFKVQTTGTSAYGSYTYSTWVTSNSSGWQLSPSIYIPDYTDDSGTQTLRVTVSSPTGGNVLVDDVLVDPWRYTSW